MKNKILQEFLNSDIKIKSHEKLGQYIDYCIENNKLKASKYITSHHHILPKALFPKYIDIKLHYWNGSHLSHSEHYYSHYLFTEAVDDYGQLYAFTSMHQKDFKNKRLKESDLISGSAFQLKMTERNKLISSDKLSIMPDGRTKAQHSREKQYSAQAKDVDENGLNGAQRATIKYHENLKNTIDEKSGLTKAEIRIQRQKATIAERGSMSGKNNSAYGFRWIYNTTLRESKRVPENELEKYYLLGWVKGMKREYCKNKK